MFKNVIKFFSNLLNFKENNVNISKKQEGIVVLCFSEETLAKHNGVLCISVGPESFFISKKNNFIDEQSSSQEEENKKMVKLLESAKFLIRLYYQTGEKYNCVRPKIEKLLSIASFIKMKDGQAFFMEDIVLKNCGVGIPQLEVFLIEEIIKKSPNNSRIDDEINFDIDVPAVYQGQDDIDEENKNLLIDIFREFGNFDSKLLGTEIDEFKNKIADGKKVSLEKAKAFFNSESVLQEYATNGVLKYIVNYVF